MPDYNILKVSIHAVISIDAFQCLYSLPSPHTKVVTVTDITIWDVTQVPLAQKYVHPKTLV